MKKIPLTQGKFALSFIAGAAFYCICRLLYHIVISLNK